MARQIIKESHPLNETPVPVAFPILKPFAKCSSKKSDVVPDVREPLLLQSVAHGLSIG